MSPFLIALLGAFSTYCLFVGVWRRKQAESRVEAFRQRLREFQRQSTVEQDMSQSAAGARLTKERDFLGRLGDQLADAAFAGSGGQSLMDAVEERLVRAGHPHGWHAPDYIAFCALSVGGAIIGGGLLVQMGIPAPLYLALVGLTAGYCHYELKAQINKRTEKAFFELPYFLDEIIMALSSGASTLDQALREVLLYGDDGLALQEKVLVTEFRRAYQETASQARPFAEAYRAAAERIGVTQVSDLVETLVEGQQSGSPILDVLKDMSMNVYRTFETEMKGLIKKKDSNFTVATVIMMSASAIVIGTPIVITVLKALGGGAAG